MRTGAGPDHVLDSPAVLGHDFLTEISTEASITMKHPPIIVVQLVHIVGPLKGEIQEFSGGTIAVGRHPSCDLRFPADLAIVSRKHAEIVREGNQFTLVDHSANGTFVNGKRVKEAVLRNGDVIAFAEGGPKVSFLTQVKEGRAEPDVAAPPPTPREPPAARRDPAVAPRPPQPEPPFRAEPSRPTAPPRPPERPPHRTPQPEPTPPRPAAGIPVEASIPKARAPFVVQYGPTLRTFRELPVSVGRNPRCHVALDHPALSDEHALFFFSQDHYWVKDLTGQGLVQVNRQPVSVQTPLNPSDEVALTPKGPVFRFLGNGRLAEVEEQPPDAPFPPREGERKPHEKPSGEEADPKRESVFRKFFK
jgi:pSer/pThr/pTyr-binding forkhead associated (FHA) protein